MRQTLREIYDQHTGKTSDKWQSYLPIYDNVLSEFRDCPVRLLEIGIQNGGSAEIWSRYFEKGRAFVGVDINPRVADLSYDDSRISVVVGDVTRRDTQTRIAEASDGFDVIIDDGSHTSGDIIRAFCDLFPRLSVGGVFVVEDMCCGYWEDFGGGVDNPMSAPSFFKALTDCVNAEHWDIDRTCARHLDEFARFYGIKPEGIGLDLVHSVSFFNSMIVVRKSGAASNTIGPRVVRGSRAKIVPDVLVLDGTKLARARHSEAQGNPGYCHCCERETVFWERDAWLRDHYLCRNCGSIPRFRALQMVLNSDFPNWKSSQLHESSPSNDNLARLCPGYSSSQYLGEKKLGQTIRGVHNENLEALTFDDETFDLFVTLDVLEHVFDPAAACREVMRVLKPGGAHVFTTPKHPGLPASYRRAELVDGKVNHILPEEYHGNPVGDGRALVTWDYGGDLEVYLSKWSGYPTVTYVTRDRSLGLDGQYLEVFVTRKIAN